MQGTGEVRRTSPSSRENQDRVSSLEKDLPRTLAYPFADQLEAWKDNGRAHSGAKPSINAPPPRDRCTSTSQQHQTRHHNTISRGPLAVYDGGGKRKKDADHEHTDDGSSTSTSAEEQEDERSLKSRAWNSGSLLVRAGSEAPSGRVPRKTYIYLVGNARAEDRIEVEVIVGAEKNRTVLSKSSGVTCASVPARDVYTVRNLSGDGKTAVLFWTSPSGDDEDADEQPRETKKDGGEEEADQGIPQPLERLPIATRNVFSAPIDGAFTYGEEEYGRE